MPAWAGSCQTGPRLWERLEPLMSDWPTSIWHFLLRKRADCCAVLHVYMLYNVCVCKALNLSVNEFSKWVIIDVHAFEHTCTKTKLLRMMITFEKYLIVKLLSNYFLVVLNLKPTNKIRDARLWPKWLSCLVCSVLFVVIYHNYSSIVLAKNVFIALSCKHSFHIFISVQIFASG